MKFSNSLRRMRTQVYSMERMLRLMRANLEEELYDFGAGGDFEGQPMTNALTDLLASDEHISMTSVSPYADFAEGVWIGYDADDPACGGNVMTQVLRANDPKEMGPRITRLIVNPVFSTKTKAKWFTLETEVDKEAFFAVDTLRLSMIGYFTPSETNRVALPKSFKITLRVTDEGGGVQDIDVYRAPVSTMPLEYGCTLNLNARQKLTAKSTSRVVLIMLLPEAGDYAFNLDHFAVHAVQS